MTTETTTGASTPRAPELVGQIVVVIGGSAGIGLETARRARAEGAEVVLVARNPERLERAARELGAQSTAAFDANDPASLEHFFEDLPTQIDHVMVTGPGPHYKPPLEMDTEETRASLGGHMVLALAVARNARGRVRPAGSLVFIGGTGGGGYVPDSRSSRRSPPACLR
jgi:NAD(P)-dependent dehydrogenase (short-subunit alcohol dehydrogenase family)